MQEAKLDLDLLAPERPVVVLGGEEYRLKSAADLTRRDAAALERLGAASSIDALDENLEVIFYDDPPETLSLLQMTTVYQYFLGHCQAAMELLGMTE